MLSVNAKKVVEIAAEYNKTLLATDPRFKRFTYLVNEDGSVFAYRNAFLMRCEDYIVVFTEHYEYQVFHMDELSFWEQYDVVDKGVLEKLKS